MQESIRELPDTGKKHDWTRRKGSYGIDAPYLLPILGVLLVGNIINGAVTGSVWPFVGAAALFACAGCGLYASRRGKIVVFGDDQIELSDSKGSEVMSAVQFNAIGYSLGSGVTAGGLG